VRVHKYQLNDEEPLVSSVSNIKKLIKKQGGYGWTEHYERDGGYLGSTPIEVKGSNAGTAYNVKYNKHL
jgi:hypothetical protein